MDTTAIQRALVALGRIRAHFDIARLVPLLEEVHERVAGVWE